MSALVEICDLVKYFPVKSGLLRRTTGHVKAVDGVSFDLNAGEITQWATGTASFTAS